MSVLGLPPELRAPASEGGFSLVFAKGPRQWFVHLWSNQLVTAEIPKAPPLVFRKERSFKFVLPERTKLETSGFYSSTASSATQRKRAVAAYERAIRTKLAEGYTLTADSRLLESAAPRPRPPRRSAAKVASLRGWPALAHCGEVTRASEDRRVTKTLAALADSTEAAVRFSALKKAARVRGAPVVVRGDVLKPPRARSFVWILGDLHVRGNLSLSIDLFVSGNLVVDGVIRDITEWTHVLVLGDVSARAIVMGSQLYAGGAVDAPVVIVDGTGELVAKKGTSSTLLVEQGYDHTLSGKPRAKHRARFDEDAERALVTLERVLRPTFTRPARLALAAKGERFYFDKRPLVAALEQKAHVFA
ncbi:MAG: hypothetical protein U0235_03845 [Polyangiaceae bacterium]